MTNTITGTLKVKGEVINVSEKFKKREFVIAENSGTYVQYISIQLTGDRCSLLDSVEVGQEITVHINLKGREWESPTGEIKYFNSIEAWKIDGITKNEEVTEDKTDLPF